MGSEFCVQVQPVNVIRDVDVYCKCYTLSYFQLVYVLCTKSCNSSVTSKFLVVGEQHWLCHWFNLSQSAIVSSTCRKTNPLSLIWFHDHLGDFFLIKREFKQQPFHAPEKKLIYKISLWKYFRSIWNKFQNNKPPPNLQINSEWFYTNSIWWKSSFIGPSHYRPPPNFPWISQSTRIKKFKRGETGQEVHFSPTSKESAATVFYMI